MNHENGIMELQSQISKIQGYLESWHENHKAYMESSSTDRKQLNIRMSDIEKILGIQVEIFKNSMETIHSQCAIHSKESAEFSRRIRATEDKLDKHESDIGFARNIAKVGFIGLMGILLKESWGFFKQVFFHVMSTK